MKTNILQMQADNGLVPAIIEAIQDKKGSKIVTLDLAALGVANASTFVVCQGNSTSQVSAIADNIRDTLLERHDVKPFNYDGYRNSQWIVIDYGDIIVHVFLPETRSFYNLEELWSDAPATVVPDLD